MITFQHSLDVKTCTATEYGLHSPILNVLIGIDEILLILKQIVLRARLADVNQMIGYLLSINHIVGQILASADIHTTIHLPRVGRDNLAVHAEGQMSGQGSFPAGGRAEYGNHPFHSADKNT